MQGINRIKMCIFAVLIALPSLACAQFYGSRELIADQRLFDEVENFQETAGVKLALAALNRTDDISTEAEFYYNLSKADMVIVYDFGNNRIAVAKPKAKEVLSDEKINKILDDRQDEKILIADNRDATAYLLHIVEDMTAELASGDESYSICSIIKDGYCNESCYQDLDCECGDGICEYHENYATCPDDCKKSDDYKCVIISDNYCDRNCPMADVDCSLGSFAENAFDIAKKKRTMAITLQIVIGAVLLMLIVILIYMMEKRGFRKRQ